MKSGWQKFVHDISIAGEAPTSWNSEKEFKESPTVTEKVKTRGSGIVLILEAIRELAPFNEMEVKNRLRELSKEKLTEILNDWKGNEYFKYKIIGNSLDVSRERQ